jgi:hypothetical protein
MTGAWAGLLALKGATHRAGNIATVLLTDESLEDDEVRLQLAEAVRLLCLLDPKEKPALRRLAEAEDGRVLLQVIEGMDGTDPLDQAVLGKLLESRGWVAEKAREKLELAGGVPFWMGTFDADPLAGLDAAAARKLLPGLKRWAKLTGTYTRTKRATNEKVRLLAGMPRTAALAAFRSVVRKGRYEQTFKDFVVAIQHHDGAAEAVCDALAADRDHRPELPFDLDRKPPHPFTPAFRRKLAAALLPRLAKAGPEALDDIEEPSWSWAHLLKSVWPASDDPWPVVELLQGWGDLEGEEDLRINFLPELITAGAKKRAWVAGLVRDAFASNGTGRFRYLEGVATGLAARLPKAERLALAEAAFDRRQPGFAFKWAVGQLIRLEPQRLAAHYEDPLVRELLFRRDHLGPVMGRARKDLRAGRLEPTEAGAALFALKAPGDCVRWSRFDRMEPTESPLDHEGGTTSRGLTAEDWEGVRAARARVKPGQELDSVDLAVHYPPGPWDPADLAFFKRAMEAALAEEEDGYRTGWLATVASYKPHPDLVPLVTRALELEEVAEEVGDALARLRKALGLPDEEPGEETAAAEDDW